MVVMSDSPIRRAALAMPNIRERAKSRAPLSDVERQSQPAKAAKGKQRLEKWLEDGLEEFDRILDSLMLSSVTIGGIPMAVVARTMMSCGANSPHIDVSHVSGIRAGDIVIGNGAISSHLDGGGQTLVVQMDAAEGDMLRVWLNRRTLASVQGGEVLFCRPYEPTVPPVAKAAAIPTGGRAIRPNRQLKSPHRG